MSLLEAIIDHKVNVTTATSKSAMYVITHRGKKKLRETTHGWKLLVKWKDVSELWIHLFFLKESHPVKLVEYIKARGISVEPGFIW